MAFASGFLILAAALFPLESIQVEGVKRLQPAQVAAASGLKIGQPAGKDEFDAAQKRLLETGVLASVAYRYGPGKQAASYSLTFEVTEIEHAFPLQFEEINKPDSELKKLLAAADPLFTEIVPATEKVIARYAKILNDALKPEIRIVGRVLSDRPGEEVLLFRPDTPRPTVATVTFTGNKAIPFPELQNRMAAVATGTLYTEERFRELLMNQIRPMYENYGLLRVTFPKIVAKEAEDVRGIDVAVTVDEGEPYKLRKVTLTGAPDAEHLLEVAKFKKDETFRLIEIVDGLERLRAELRSDGYMKVSTNSTRTYDDEAKAVDMQVQVTLGDQYTMGKLTIQGLDILSEPVVRKMWGLDTGVPFKDGYPERFLTVVREQGIFDNLGETKSKNTFDEKRKVIDVTLVFSGQKSEPAKRRRQF